jgi:hypothetical protein
MQSSTYKGFMAGIATVAVALSLGFGGGVMIADWFGSDGAVPAQSKIEKAKAPDPRVEATPQPTGDAPKAPKDDAVTANTAPAPSPLSQPVAATVGEATARVEAATTGAVSAEAMMQPQPRREAVPDGGAPQAQPARPQTDAPKAREPQRSARDTRNTPAKAREVRKPPVRSADPETTAAASREVVLEDDDRNEIVGRRREEVIRRNGERVLSREVIRERARDEDFTEFREAPSPRLPFFPFFAR